MSGELKLHLSAGDITAQWQQVQQLLAAKWGYDSLRPAQAEIVDCLLRRQDCLALLPTGGGKSLCFQLPALLQDGLTLVISPLLALMADQVQDLQKRQLGAATLHSNLAQGQRRQVLQDLPHLRLLYLSPETLLSPPVWQRLCAPDLKINGIMLDEAHCLVQWGDSFRPSYRRLAAVRKALEQAKPTHPPIALAAFTATADPATETELVQALELRQPQRVGLSPYRSNLSLAIATAWSPSDRQRRLWQLIEKYGIKKQEIKGQTNLPTSTDLLQTGLIYVRTRQDTETLTQWLREKFAKHNYPNSAALVMAYHAGLAAPERHHIEQQWLQGHCPIVVCTNAFGMGINKPNCRWICHYHKPLSLAEYIQEVGRAGRDGQLAHALMLVSEPTGWIDSSDQQRESFFLQQQQKQKQRAERLLAQLPPQGDYQQVCQGQPDLPLTLAILHRLGQLNWLTPFRYELLHTAKEKHQQSKLPPKMTPHSPEQAVKAMTNYIASRQCRWYALLDAFGFSPEANWRCGICDRCQTKN
ncbi:MAG: RecQ family ATP-dependent DNA helicase [Pseudanabaena sp. ELA607]